MIIGNEVTFVTELRRLKISPGLLTDYSSKEGSAGYNYHAKIISRNVLC
jgi:hypothetical protein